MPEKVLGKLTSNENKSKSKNENKNKNENENENKNKNILLTNQLVEFLETIPKPVEIWSRPPALCDEDPAGQL